MGTVVYWVGSVVASVGAVVGVAVVAGASSFAQPHSNRQISRENAKSRFITRVLSLKE